VSRYSKVARSMWREPLFRELSAEPGAALLYLRLLTGAENTSLPGLFPAWASGIAESLRWTKEDFLERFAELESKGFAEADWPLGLVWLPRAVDVNRPESPNVIKSWRATWDELPACELKVKAHARLLAVTTEMGPAFSKAFQETCSAALPEALPKASPKALANQEQEQEQEQEKIAPAAPLVLSAEPPTAPVKQSKGKPKHAPEQIAAKDRIVEAFIAGVKLAKGVEPKLAHAGEHAAAFAIAKAYGADEAVAIVTRATADPFVLGSNCTIRYIAGKADSWRGTATAKPGAIVQRDAGPVRAWTPKVITS
jgi:hypothetical protein